MYRLIATLLTALLLGLVSGCGPSPTPEPTPTPIPGYVAGEEEYAYASFIEYYTVEIEDCYFDDWISNDVVAGVDEDYQGKAVYVGDSIWRFYLQTWWMIPDPSQEEEFHYEEKMIEVR